jgi:hypothetical protein
MSAEYEIFRNKLKTIPYEINSAYFITQHSQLTTLFFPKILASFFDNDAREEEQA